MTGKASDFNFGATKVLDLVADAADYKDLVTRFMTSVREIYPGVEAVEVHHILAGDTGSRDEGCYTCKAYQLQISVGDVKHLGKGDIITKVDPGAVKQQLDPQNYPDLTLFIEWLINDLRELDAEDHWDLATVGDPEYIEVDRLTLSLDSGEPSYRTYSVEGYHTYSVEEV